MIKQRKKGTVQVNIKVTVNIQKSVTDLSGGWLQPQRYLFLLFCCSFFFSNAFFFSFPDTPQKDYLQHLFSSRNL